jgi:Protein  of unknown function (DUF3018)
MRSMRLRRQSGGLREVRLVVPDARSGAVRRRVAAAVAALNSAAEQDALAWIETVSEFDTAAQPSNGDAAR